MGGGLQPPPGPVSGTMKTLDQVEPRIPIDSLPFTIIQSGSYYLTRNLSYAGPGPGIRIINPSNGRINVSIDGLGHTLVGGPLSGSAVQVVGPNCNQGCQAAIEDIEASGWGSGGEPVIDAAGTSSRMISITITSTSSAMVCGDDSEADDCRVTRTSGSAARSPGSGIVMGARSRVTNCTVTGYDAGGILLGQDSLVDGCVCAGNTGDGVIVGPGGLVTHCTVTGAGGFGRGIALGAGARVEGCVVRSNGSDGILVDSRCLVLANTCSDNGFGGNPGAGIRANGSRNRIEANQVTAWVPNNDIGIYIVLQSGNNLIVRNSVSGYSQAYSIAAGNHYGAIHAGGAGFSSSNAWANFSLP
jgi:hypothetical protein